MGFPLAKVSKYHDLEDDELDLLKSRPFKSRPNINSLPKEILLRIFEEVYQASLRIEVDSPKLNDIADSRLFPDCIANVCKAWRELLQSFARFSTRLFIFVDEPISNRELRTKFRMSQDLPIKVFVVRRDYTVEEDADEEHRVAEVTKLLVGHITRCEVVMFDLLHGSSLPRFSGFSGKAKDLRFFKARGRIFDSTDDPFIPTPSLFPTSSLIPTPSPFLRQPSFCCPNLRIMDLDCRTFLEASSIPGWAESTRDLGQKELTIRHGRNIPLHHFLRCLSRLEHLFSLKLVEVDLDPSSCVGLNLVSIFIQNFEFEGLSGESVSGFFNNHINTIEVSSIALTRCGLEVTEYLASWSLVLSDIDAEEDISGFVQHWNGHSLGINNCPGVDDTMLVLLSDFQSSREGSLLNAHSLRELQIRTSGIIPISVKTLQELVMIREVISEQYGPSQRAALGSSITLPMYSVSISGLGSKPDPVEMKWFNDHLDNFTWLADPLPSDSPVLDWDISQLDSSQLDHLDLDFQLSGSSDTLFSSSQPPESCLSQCSHPSPSSFDGSYSTRSPELSTTTITTTTTTTDDLTQSPVLNDDMAILEWSPEDLLNIP